ncbi:MAG: hypothetical protein RBR47_07240 [Bacteroidales bacterium]|nr:hypothetical protein [Bacteroidales bacterium]MDY0334738.1 hypothetical protein [Bacteroidales bacterium]NLO51314.1 carboxypeptidase-like regulatory domain-containing protein [Bacteroidales bacterium]
MKISMRSKILIFALLFRCSLQAGAQQTTMLAGQVIDAETGEAVSYAAAEIISKNLGAAANAEGRLQFAISESMMDETVTFSALAYFSRQVAVKELLAKQPFKVELEKKTYTLPEFTIRANSKEKVRLGNFPQGYRTSMSVTTVGKKTAVFMDNTKGSEGIIKSISYGIVKRDRLTKSHPRTPFRVRIFAVDSLTGGPGEDLLTEYLVVKPRGAGWFTVDVSKYNIKTPKEGYFAAMEWVYSKEKYYYEIIAGGQPQQVYGQSLGIIFGDFTPNTWHKYLGFEWYFDERVGRAEEGFTNSLINSEVGCFK